MAAQFGDDKRSSGGVGGIGRPRRISSASRGKTAPSRQRRPRNAENLHEIKSLSTIWHSSSAGVLKAAGRGLAAELGTPFSCLFVQHENLT
jgi:hypothetical protein